jgi:hypothetical protein
VPAKENVFGIATGVEFGQPSAAETAYSEAGQNLKLIAEVTLFEQSSDHAVPYEGNLRNSFIVSKRRQATYRRNV